MKKMFNKAVLNGTTVMGDGLTYPRIPNVYTGNNEGGYQRGDMMDANAVVEMIKELTDTGKITIEELQNLINEEIQERVEGDQDQQRYTDQKIKDLIGTSPETLDTLKEIADALGEDPDFAANVWNKIAELTTKHNEDVQELQDAITSGFENIDFTPYVKKTDVVTDTTNGLMLASDKVKLDAFEEAEQYSKAVNLTDYVLGTNGYESNIAINHFDDHTNITFGFINLENGGKLLKKYIIYSATHAKSGVMSASDKEKLDSLVKYKAGNGIDITGDTISCTLDNIDVVSNENDGLVKSIPRDTSGLLLYGAKANGTSGWSYIYQTNTPNGIEIYNSLFPNNYFIRINTATTFESGLLSSNDKYKLNSLKNYKAGNGIDITGDTISCTLDTSLYSIVTELPETGLPNKIYLLPSTKTEEGNVYTEYGYVDNKWEEIGKYKADVDLSPYSKALHLPSDVIKDLGVQSGANYVNVYSYKEDLDRGILSEVSEFDIPKATSEKAGIITAQDKAKLDGIEAGAQVNKIESVSVNGTPLEITNKGVDIPIHEYTAGDGINISEGVISTTPISIKTEEFSFVNSGSHQPTYNYSGVTIYDDRYTSGTKYGIAFDEADIKPRTTITSPDGVRTVCFALDQSVRRKIENAITSIKVNNVEQVNANGAVNLTIPNATTSKEGLMSKEDKTKLDSLENYTLPAATTTTLGGVKMFTPSGSTYNSNYSQAHIDSDGIIWVRLELLYDNNSKSITLVDCNPDVPQHPIISTINCTDFIKDGPIASITENGLMSKEDKTKLDSQPTIKASNATGVTDDDYIVIKKSELNSILSRLSALENKA